ncbi:MAG: M28 family peptidase [Thermoguttaceae bacterium]|nr:M28 family peptidase [Thermoguttaceae bacterium]MDW8078501.1 M28 family peptidase [Thermoguttaceae bacterium]
MGILQTYRIKAPRCARPKRTIFGLPEACDLTFPRLGESRTWRWHPSGKSGETEHGLKTGVGSWQGRARDSLRSWPQIGLGTFRHPFLTLAVVAWTLFFPCLDAACGADRAGGSIEAALASITATELREHVSFLADPAFEGREAGSPAAQKAAHWLAEQLRQIGLTPAGVDGGFLQPFGQGMTNVLGLIPGSDAELAQQFIVVGAHFDHIGYGRKREGEPRVYPGADDNASGVAGVLELAEACSMVSLKRSVLVALWDGEEKGLLGSKHWAKSPTIPLQRIVISLNLDMVGRLRENSLQLVGVRSGGGWRRLFVLQNPGDLSLRFSWNLRPDSDHVTFFNVGVPSVMFHTGLHEDYHQPTDTAERINYEGAERVVRYAFVVLHDLANREELPKFRPEARDEKPPDEVARPLPRLGIECRPSSDTGPVEIVRVLEGFPAAEAGLQSGDRITKIAGQPLAAFEELLKTVATAEEVIELTVEKAEGAESRQVRIPLRGKPAPFGLLLGLDPADPGVAVVLDVVPLSAGATAGLKRGDRIWEIDGQPLGNDPLTAVEEWARNWQKYSSRPSLRLTIEREGRVIHIDLAHPSRN